MKKKKEKKKKKTTGLQTTVPRCYQSVLLERTCESVFTKCFGDTSFNGQ